MNRTIQDGSPRSWSHAYPLPVQNVASQNAPPYAVMQVFGSTLTDSGTMYYVGKPTGGVGAYVFNTPEALAPQAYGSAAEGIGIVAITGPLAMNQEVGPTAGSWVMSDSGKGYLFLGGYANGVGRVIKKPSGTDYPIVRIVNNSGVTLPVGSICGFGTPYTFPPDVQTSVYTWHEVAPTANKPFCVLLSDIPTGTTGDAAPVGVVSCQVNVTDATHEYADVANGNRTNLVSGKTGQARILWRANGLVAGPASLGVQWCIVRIGAQASKFQYGEVYSTVTAQASWTTPGTGQVQFKTDAGSNDGTPISVDNLYKHSYANGDVVLCDRTSDPPRIIADHGGGGQTAYTAAINTPIPAGDAQDLTMGHGRIYRVGPSGVTQIAEDTLYNPFPIEVSGSVTCVRVAANWFLITGIAPYFCKVMPNVVTDVSCYTDPNTGAKSIKVVQDTLHFLTTNACQQQSS